MIIQTGYLAIVAELFDARESRDRKTGFAAPGPNHVSPVIPSSDAMGRHSVPHIRAQANAALLALTPPLTFSPKSQWCAPSAPPEE